MTDGMIFFALLAGAFLCATKALDNAIWFVGVAAFGLAAFAPRIDDLVTGWPIWF